MKYNDKLHTETKSTQLNVSQSFCIGELVVRLPLNIKIGALVSLFFTLAHDHTACRCIFPMEVSFAQTPSSSRLKLYISHIQKPLGHRLYTHLVHG